MSTLILQSAGAAIGSVFGPIGAILGRAAGALAGNLIDQSILNSGTRRGPHLGTARVPGTEEGTPINRVYGTMRVSGTMIWATRFEEDVVVESRSGGKGSGPRTETFRYYANFALGLCEGEIAFVRRIWADGRELDQSTVNLRIYTGSASQLPDPLIEAKQGAGRTPAYRGLAYVVFEKLPLDAYGNRIPMFQFEVVRSVGALESQIRAVTLIPGATEHGYSVSRVTDQPHAGSTRILNRHILHRRTDWEASMDELQRLCPNLKSVALVVSWFATDLRAGSCRVVPGVEVTNRNAESAPWQVSGVSRINAYSVSQTNGVASFGGTPNDASVVEAIRDLKARGLEVVLYPFLLVDVPPGNTLPNPYGGTGQPPFPWRGRITCFPATSQPGSADKTANARSQISVFVGAASAAQFTQSGTVISYDGTEESYRRLILHYALLARAAGGVSGFLLGSEMIGLTHVRDQNGAFPFVEALQQLAGDVRSLLGPSTKITYAADWSEYFSYQPGDGSGEVHYPLDPLWASPAVSAVGIDNYMPLSDWRDEDLASVQPDGFRLADDKAAMQRAITSGEGFNWYYASTAARKARTRTVITDSLAGKPWVYRNKDIESWWSNRHYPRIGGVETATPTAWLPKMKPVWFTELGCPSVDKGANQPNVFPDPKSSESRLPYFSGGQRSDAIQRRMLQAHMDHWGSASAPSGMVDEEKIFLWTWDARPHPAFPEDQSAFADGANWQTGHWLNGRLGSGTVADIIAAILSDHGFSDFNVDCVSGDLTGFVQGDLVSARQMLEPILEAFSIDVLDDGGVLTFRSRGKLSAPHKVLDILADPDKGPVWEEKRGQAGDYAGLAILDYFDEAGGYDRSSVRSRRLSAGNNRTIRTALSGVLPEATAMQAAEAQLRDHQLSRRTISFALPPSDLSLQPGDPIALADGPDGTFLVTHIADGDVRQVEARAFALSAGSGLSGAMQQKKAGTSDAASLFTPVLHLMDLPRYEAGNASDFARAAVSGQPWRLCVLSSSPATEGYQSRVQFDRPARIGNLATPLLPGRAGRFDYSVALIVSLGFGSLSSASKIAVLSGVNRLAVKAANGVWEILSFLNADETAPGQWRLTGLLRGQAGTEDAMLAGANAGSAVVVLDSAVKSLGLTSSEAGLSLNWLLEAVSTDAPTQGPLSFAGGLRAETPLAPVHLKAKRLASGDVRFSWKRRSRIDADSWQATEIPLDEPVEAYQINIIKNNAVVRSAEIDTPLWTYPLAMQQSDFGTAQTAMSIRLRQIGSKVADGLPLSQTIPIL